MLFTRKETANTLDEVLDLSFKMLDRGVKNFRDPFHQAALATVRDGIPEVRTVIFRGFSASERTLTCHCDGRTPKVVQINKSPHVSWLFYHPKKMIQIRLSGAAHVHTDDPVAESQWKNVRTVGKINYCTEKPPGAPADHPASGLPALFQDKVPKMMHGITARKNFTAIVCRFDRMDWLKLRLLGNIRARFDWKNNQLTASWIIP